MRTWLQAILSLIVILFMVQPTIGANTDPPTPDPGDVAHAAIKILVTSAGNPNNRVGNLMFLADVLSYAGDARAAHEALVAAGTALDAVNPVDRDLLGGQLAVQFAQAGDLAQAEALVADLPGADGSDPVLLARLGIARARGGDKTGALTAAAKIIAPTQTAASTAMLQGNSPYDGVAWIGMALSESDAPEAAMQLAEALPDGLPKQRILSRVAQSLCGPRSHESSDSDLRQKVIERVLKSAPAGLPAISEPLGVAGGSTKYSPEVVYASTAAVAIAECRDADQAKALVAKLVPREMVDTVPLGIGRYSRRTA
jgi:hypothetical protein